MKEMNTPITQTCQEGLSMKIEGIMFKNNIKCFISWVVIALLILFKCKNHHPVLSKIKKVKNIWLPWNIFNSSSHVLLKWWVSKLNLYKQIFQDFLHGIKIASIQPFQPNSKQLIILLIIYYHSLQMTPTQLNTIFFIFLDY